VEFGFPTGSGRLFQADGPAQAKARQLCSVHVGTLKTRDWKTRDLKSMESVTIFKSNSYGAEIETVYGGMVAMLKASVHQHVALQQ